MARLDERIAVETAKLLAEERISKRSVPVGDQCTAQDAPHAGSAMRFNDDADRAFADVNLRTRVAMTLRRDPGFRQSVESLTASEERLTTARAAAADLIPVESKEALAFVVTYLCRTAALIDERRHRHGESADEAWEWTRLDLMQWQHVVWTPGDPPAGAGERKERKRIRGQDGVEAVELLRLVLARVCIVPGCGAPSRELETVPVLSARRELYLRQRRARPLMCVEHAALRGVERAARGRVRDLLVAASRSLVGKPRPTRKALEAGPPPPPA